VAYGTWGYPAYSPFYWSPPGFVASNVVSFAAGVAVGAAIWGGCDWWQHNVVINVARFNVFNRADITNNVWTHNPAHRGDVPYRNVGVAERFGRVNTVAARDALRDRVDAERPDMSRALEGAGNAAEAIAPAGLATRVPDVARNVGRRQASRVTMPPRNFDRPMVNPRPQWMRSRAQLFRPPARAFGGGGARFGGHFGGGWHRL
jgi:hypothetical protein